MTYRAKFWALVALAFGAAAIAGVVIGISVPASGGVDNPTLVLPLLLALVCAVMLAAWPMWQKTDDVQKQGQLLSWWWGGTFGALVMIVVLVVMTGRHSDISLGAGYLFLAEGAGMGLAFLIWKLRGRGLSE